MSRYGPRPRSTTFASSTGALSSRVYLDLFCAEIEQNPNGVLARLCAPFTAVQVRDSFERRSDVEARYVSFSLVRGWNRVESEEAEVTTWSETSGMRVQVRSLTARPLVAEEQADLQQTLDDLAAAAADPKHGGPRSLIVIRKPLSVSEDLALAAIHAEPTFAPDIAVHRSDPLGLVLLADESLIGRVSVGKSKTAGDVVEAQLVRTPGDAADSAASPQAVEAVITAVAHWASGHAVSGRDMQVPQAHNQGGAWLAL